MWEILGAIIFLLLFLIILIVGLVVTAASSPNSILSTGSSSQTASTLPPCSLDEVSTDLSQTPCCCNGSILTGQRYYPALDMIISPNPINNALGVCVGYCNNGYDGETKTCRPGDLSGQENYDRCMKRFNPEGTCAGLIRPIGHINTVLYYPIAVGKTGVCSSTIASENPALNQGTCISTINNICLI